VNPSAVETHRIYFWVLAACVLVRTGWDSDSPEKNFLTGTAIWWKLFPILCCFL